MLDIYKASAGAGKTFALTLEYFRTIFASPTEYGSSERDSCGDLHQ